MKVRGKVDKAKTISEIPLTCGYYPLDSEDLLKFYIDASKARGVDVFNRLKRTFKPIPRVYHQVLFLGHLGTGKSTIMYKLEKALSDNYKVLRFSVQEVLDVNKMTFVDLLCAMYEQVLSKCSEVTKAESKLLQRIYDTWYATTSWEKETETDFDFSVTSEAGLGVKTKLVSLLSKISSTMRMGSSERERIHINVSRRVQEYISLLNDLSDMVSDKYNKPLLLMFEDLEKIPRNCANQIFDDNGTYFKDIKLNMLLAAPIYLKYSMKFKNIISQNFTATERCPMIAVTNANREISELGFETMRNIVYARISEDLIERNVLNTVISYSGGVLRDLLFMITEASRECQANSISKIDIEYAFYKLQESYCDGLRNRHVEVINRVYNNPYGLIEDEDELNLMHAEVIIEYNGEQWKGVHPAVVSYLNKRGLLKK